MKNDNDNGGNERFNKIGRIMEKFWLVLAIASLAGVIFLFFSDGMNRENVQYLVFPAMAGAMYGFRLFYRKRVERHDPGKK